MTHTTSTLVCCMLLFAISAQAQNEPTGKHKIGRGLVGSETIDFDFPLIYADEPCPAGYFVVDEKPFKDNGDYRAPRLAKDKELWHFVYRNLRYPQIGVEQNIQGTVILSVLMTKSGAVERVAVKKGVHPALDKEAARVMRMIPVKTPARLNGEPVDACLTVPISFRME